MTDAAHPPHRIRPMTLDDHAALEALLRQTPGVTWRDADSVEAIGRYLVRNPGLSFIAEVSGTPVGCVMSGHDGRRGHLHHLVVHPDHRRRGIASQLVTRCLDGLEKLGILKSHIDVFRDNESGSRFWERIGWQRRTDVHRYSIVRGGGENA